ncbi:MAG: hypothetical protein ACAI44_15520 [Candidatus Sericytochromatia bacterium]
MQIQRQVITDPTKFVRGSDNALTGVNTVQGSVAAVTDAASLPQTVAKGDLYIKVNDNQVLQLTLSEPATREQLLEALYQEIGKLDPKDVTSKHALLETYLTIAKSSGNVPSGTELGQRVAELETKLSQLETSVVGNEASTELRLQLSRKFPGLKSELYADAIAKMASGKPKDVIEGFGRLSVLLANEPQGKELLAFLRDKLEPVGKLLDKNPATKSLASIFNKTFLDPDPAKSVARIKHLATLAELSDPKVSFGAKHVRALFETINEYGGDIAALKSLLPQAAQQKIEKLELWLGSKTPEVIRKLLPMADKVDFAKAVLKFLAADNNVSRTAGVIDFMTAVGKNYAKDSKMFNAICEFMKMNTLLEDHWKTLFESGGKPSTAAQKLTALSELSKAYQVKVMEFALKTQTISFTAQQLAELGAKNSDEALKLFQSLGLNDPATFSSVLKKMEAAGESGTEAILKAFTKEAKEMMGKLGTSSASEAVSLMSKLGISAESTELLTKLGLKKEEFNAVDAALKALKDLGLEGKTAKQVLETFEKAGVKSAQEAFELIAKLEKQGVTTLEQAAKLSATLGVKTGAEAAEALTKLGVQTPEEAAKLVKKLGAKSTEEALGLLTTLGAKNGAEALEAIAKIAPNMPLEQLTRYMGEMGIKDAKDALKLMEKMGATNLEQCYQVTRRLAAKSGEEAAKIMADLGYKTATECTQGLASFGKRNLPELAKALGVTDTKTALQMAKKMNITSVEAAEKVMQDLAGYGVKNGEQAMELMTKLGLSDVRKVATSMSELGVKTLAEANSLFAKLGAQNAPEALETLSKIGLKGKKPAEIASLLSKAGITEALNPENITKLGSFVEKMGVTDLSKALTDMGRLGFASLDDAISLMPELGVKNADEAIALMSKFGYANISDALLDANKLGTKVTFKQATEIMSKFGPFTTSTLGNTAAKLGFKGMTAQTVLDAVKTFGLDPNNAENIPKALEQMEKIGAKSAREAYDLMQKMGVKTMQEVVDNFAKLGVKTATEGIEVMSKLGGNFAKASEAAGKLGSGTLKDAAEVVTKLGVGSADEAVNMLAKFGAANGAEALELLSKVGATNAKEAVALMEKMGYGTVKEAAAKFDKLGVSTAKEGVSLLNSIGKNMPQLLEDMGKLGTGTAKQFTETLSKLGAANVTEALEMVKKLGCSSATEAVDLIGKTGAKNAAEALKIMEALEVKTLKEAAATGEKKLGKIAELVEKLGLKEETKLALMRIMRELDNEGAELFLKELGTIDKGLIEGAAAVLKHLPVDTAAKIFTNKNLGLKFFAGVGHMAQGFGKMGISVLEIAPKLAKGLGKAIPAAGALVSAYDAAKLGTIAVAGKDFSGKAYNDPDVRALALIGAGLNAVDSALGIAEAFGVGNVGFLANLGLAAAEIGVDIMVDYFNDHPEKMPSALRTGIRCAAAGLAVAAPLSLPGAGLGVTAALAVIYKDELKEVVNELYKKGEAGVKKIGELANQGVEAAKAKMNQVIDDIMAGAGNMMEKLNKLYQQGGQVAKQVMDKLIAKLNTAWQNSSWDNNYQGIRDMLNEMYTQAKASGSAAVTMLRDAVKTLDNDYCGGNIPDFLYDW